MVVSAAFNNISARSWRSVSRKPEYSEKTTDLSQVTDKLYHIMSELTTLVVIGTDCIDSCKSNYHAITTTTSPSNVFRNKNVGI